MTNINFYILPHSGRQARLDFACRLIEKAQRLGNRVFIACKDDEEAKLMDELLWKHNPESFIPHALLSACNDESVEIGTAEQCGEHHQVLINLSDSLPDYFSRFERLTEIVVQDEAVLTQTRSNWAFYKQRGYPVVSHDMRQ